MATVKAIVYSLVVAVISVAGLVATRGLPTVPQALNAGVPFFLIAFVVLRFLAPHLKRRIEQKDQQH